MRQRARPVIEPCLERTRTLLRLDAPAPDLDFFLDLQNARHREHEPRYCEGRLQRRAGAWVQLRRIPDERELFLIRVAQRQMTRRLGPREAPPYRDRALLLTFRGPQRA